MLLNSHLYIGQYCHTYELIKDKLADKQQEVKIRLCVNLQHNQQTHNLPTAKEIAIIIPEEKVYYTIDNRNVVLQAREGQFQRISQNSPLYVTLCYILLFSKGKNSQHPKNFYLWCSTKRTREEWKIKRQKGMDLLQVVSNICYYVYCFYIRDGLQPYLFYGKSQSDWKNVFCITIKRRTVLFMTFLDYI